MGPHPSTPSSRPNPHLIRFSNPRMASRFVWCLFLSFFTLPLPWRGSVQFWWCVFCFFVWFILFWIIFVCLFCFLLFCLCLFSFGLFIWCCVLFFNSRGGQSHPMKFHWTSCPYRATLPAHDAPGSMDATTCNLHPEPRVPLRQLSHRHPVQLCIGSFIQPPEPLREIGLVVL